MTATQVRPYPTSGSWSTITETSTKLVAKASANITTLPAAAQHQAVLAANSWHNCAGSGTIGAFAQKVAHAQGVQLQDV